MDEAIQFIQDNIQFAPWIIFGLLLLAGLNIPVSEDAMLFISGVLAAQHPERLWEFFAAVFMGAYISDLMCYWIGRKLGPSLWKIKFFAKMVKPEKVELISGYYERYGFLTLLVGRFIPFGVRNALFLTAGLGKMNFLKFSLSDFIACIVSVSVYFYLYFTFGEVVIFYAKKANVLIFSMAAIAITVMLWKKYKKKLA